MKRFLKPAAWSALICLCMLMFSGCEKESPVVADNDSYVIQNNDGQYSLHFKERPISPAELYAKDYEETGTMINVSVGRENPKFASVREMKQGILKGEFSVNQLYSLSLNPRNADGSLKLFDLDAMYDVRLPEEYSLKHVAWKGNTYEFDFTSEIGTHGYVNYCDKSSYDKAFQEKYYDFLEDQYVGSEWHLEDRNATVTRYTNRTGAYACVRYVIENEGWTVHVLETYKDGYLEDAAPVSINLFGTNGSEYFDSWVSDLTSRPSVEWISSFGLTPYVEE